MRGLTSRELFRAGHIARAQQRHRVECMAAILGIDEGTVLRNYGWPSLPEEPRSVVYLIGHCDDPADGEPVKIGFAKRLRNRMENLQAGSIKPLVLVAWIEGGHQFERELHERFFYARIRGDWFEMGADIREAFGLPEGEAEDSAHLINRAGG